MFELLFCVLYVAIAEYLSFKYLNVSSLYVNKGTKQSNTFWGILAEDFINHFNVHVTMSRCRKWASPCLSAEVGNVNTEMFQTL